MPTLAELQIRLGQYREAEARVLKSQEYTISDGGINRRMRRADLAQIQAMIRELERDIETKTREESAGGRRILYGRPSC